MSALSKAAVAALLVVGVATGAAVGAQSTPTVAPSDATVAVGETTTIAVPLSAAPDGLSGFNLTVEVAGENARVVDARSPTSSASRPNGSKTGKRPWRASTSARTSRPAPRTSASGR